MRSIKEWRIKENLQNGEWDRIKAMKFAADPALKALVSPRIEKIQEDLVAKLGENNPKIKTFRDVPPEIRDHLAQAILSSTLESFFVNSPAIQPQQQIVASHGEQPTLPQDELRTPAASKG
jgi:hypothetical protein